MERYKKGMMARSKAGRDSGRVYVIMDAEGAYVYLADGRYRTVEHPKKKKIRHIQLIGRECDLSRTDNAQIRKMIKEYNREEEF